MSPAFVPTALSPPLLSLLRSLHADRTEGEFHAIFSVITDGVPSTMMVAYPGSITRTEAPSVASYIWSVNHRSAKS